MPRTALMNGVSRMRLPLAAKIALLMAGRVGGRAGSPSPVGGLLVFKKWTSISGAVTDFRNLKSAFAEFARRCLIRS